MHQFEYPADSYAGGFGLPAMYGSRLAVVVTGAGVRLGTGLGTARFAGVAVAGGSFFAVAVAVPVAALGAAFFEVDAAFGVSTGSEDTGDAGDTAGVAGVLTGASAAAGSAGFADEVWLGSVAATCAETGTWLGRSAI